MMELFTGLLAFVAVQANDPAQTGIALQPFDPISIVKIAVFNPVFWVVGFLMGRRADQPQKILVAGFVAALVGYGVVWLATFVGLLAAKGIGGATGVFMIGIFIGMFSAAIGYAFARRSS